MKQLISRFINNGKNNGLLLIDLPTGTGKSTKIIDFIVEFIKCKSNKKKIIFITSYKKNLQVDEMKKKLGNDMLFLDNNTDALIENFSRVKNDIPKIIRDNIVTKKIIKIINTIEKFPSSKDVLRENLDSNYEKRFRSIIQNYIEKDLKTGKQLTYAEKKALINSKEYKWITELYPATLTFDKKVLLMSMDKFMAKNSTIIEPSYSFIDSKIIKNSVIVIDEFDSTKQIILNNLINQATLNKISFFDLYRKVISALETINFTNDLVCDDVLKDEKFDTNLTSSNVIENVKKIAFNIRKKYKLNYLQKLDEEISNGYAFLFQDYDSQIIMNAKFNFIKFKLDADKSQNIIKSVEKIEDDNVLENLVYITNEIKGFIKYFINATNILANNYYKKREKKNKLNQYDNYTLEAARKTVLAEFGIEGQDAEYICEQVKFNNLIRKLNLKAEIKNQKTFYKNGFSYYIFKDSSDYETQSKIETLSFLITPEQIMLYMSQKTKVIGMSATAKDQSVIYNYNIDFLKNELGEMFIEETEEETKRLDQYVISFQKDISKINIKPSVIKIYDNIQNELDDFDDNTKTLIIDNFNKFFGNNDCADNLYRKKRYLKLFKCIKVFLQDKKMNAFMFLTNVSLKPEYTEFDLNFAKQIFYSINVSLNNKINSEIISLYGSQETYSKSKNETLKLLKKRNKVFLVSSYQTIGAGQNLQYEIDEIEENDVVINDINYETLKKDFDSIYLDTPTHVFFKIDDNNYEENSKNAVLAKYIFQLKYLEETGELSFIDVEKRIDKAFRQIYLHANNYDEIPNTKSVKLAYARIIQQAIGRICRTAVKSQNVHIFYDEKIVDWLSGLEKYYNENRINAEFKKLLKETKNGENPINCDCEDNIRLLNIKKSRGIISKIMGNWSLENIEQWEKIRKYIVQNPTIDTPDKELEIFYIHLPKKNNYYHAYFFNGKKIKDTKFYLSYKTDENERYCSKRVNLDYLLHIQGVKDFLSQNNYCTFLKKCDYILNPYAFDSIYKGALGEYVGKFLIERELKIVLQSTREAKKYEKFDYFYGDVCIDFKNKNMEFENPQKELEKVKLKLIECSGKFAIIINILEPYQGDLRPRIQDNVLIIPYLYSKKFQKNQQAFAEISKILANEN